MIRNFSDRAANERTFLGWVRTAIAVMAFGFLVEKFDLFLQVAAPSLAGGQLSIPGQKFANLLGLSLIVVGTGAEVVMTTENEENNPMKAVAFMFMLGFAVGIVGAGIAEVAVAPAMALSIGSQR